MLNVINYMKNNENWRVDLTQEPFCLKIQENGRYINLKYDMLASDFSNPIVQECRGLILEKDTYRILACPFFKFFNHGERNAHKIDWATATYEEKFDGSLMKVWYDDIEEKWVISSNGNALAKNATIPATAGQVYKDFESLFLATVKFDITQLPKGYTHVFELISPHNQIVVQYKEMELIHLMSRNNATLEECDITIPNTRKPKRIKVNSLEDLLALTGMMSSQEEGFIVVDANNNRIKVKSIEYIKAHHLVTSFTELNLLRVIRNGEAEEIKAYLKGKELIIDKTVQAYADFVAGMEAEKARYLALMGAVKDRKEYAMAIKDDKHKHFGFEVYKNPMIKTMGYIGGLRDEVVLNLVLELRK